MIPEMTPGEWALWAMAVPAIVLALVHLAAFIRRVRQEYGAVDVCFDCPLADCDVCPLSAGCPDE